MDNFPFPVNTKVCIAGHREDCGNGIVEGKVLVSVRKKKSDPEEYKIAIAVRFWVDQINKRGREYLSDKNVLNPNGHIQKIYCIPSPDLIAVGAYSERKIHERRSKGKTGRKASKTS